MSISSSWLTFLHSPVPLMDPTFSTPYPETPMIDQEIYPSPIYNNNNM